MSENAENIEVTVTVPEIETPEVVETPAPVTVITTDSGAGDDAETAAAIDHEGRLVALEMGQAAILEAISQVAAAVTTQAAATEEIAAEVEEVAATVEEVAAEEQADPEDDEEPEREHPFYRERSFFGRKA